MSDTVQIERPAATTLEEVLVETIVVQQAEVTIYASQLSPDPADLRGFEIRTSTGYRAVFPNAHTECDREPCVKPRCRVKHSPTKCHGPHHIQQIRELAQQVAKTYGRGLKDKVDPSVGRVGRTTLSGGATGIRVPNMSTREWASTDWARTMESAVEA